jgi:hypothetical protein
VLKTVALLMAFIVIDSDRRRAVLPSAERKLR